MNLDKTVLPFNCYLRGSTGPKGDKGEDGLPGLMGPMGPTGPSGIGETIQLGNVETGEIGQIVDRKEGNTHILDFVLPKGEKGDKGDKGEDGTSVTIMGSYNTLQELEQAHAVGKGGDAYLVDEDLYVWSTNENKWIDVGKIKGPKGDKGDRGERGPSGISTVPISFFMTTSKDLSDGDYLVEPSYNVPIAAKTTDTDDLFYVNSVNDTITFFKAGTYRVDFSVLAKIPAPVSPQTNSNIISIGFKKVGDPTVYAGSTIWGDYNTPTLVTGTGIIELPYDKEWFELTNLGKNSFYVESPSLDQLNTEYALVSPAVTIVIQKIK